MNWPPSIQLGLPPDPRRRPSVDARAEERFALPPAAWRFGPRQGNGRNRAFREPDIARWMTDGMRPPDGSDGGGRYSVHHGVEVVKSRLVPDAT